MFFLVCVVLVWGPDSPKEAPAYRTAYVDLGLREKKAPGVHSLHITNRYACMYVCMS